MMPMPYLPAVTLLSLLHFCGALGWCAAVLISVAGYGAVLLRLARVSRFSLALAATTGFGVLLALGGVLDLLHQISVPVLLGVVAVGLLGGGAVAGLRAFAGRATVGDSNPPGSEPLHSPRAPLTPAGKVLFAVFALVFAVRLGATVHTPYYQPSDDYNFYLAAPVKMLQTHVFGADPFSERRVMSSLGGNHLLETLVLTELPLEDVQMADRALGLLLAALVAFALARTFALTPTETAAWALFVIATPQLQFNLTFVNLPAALFLGMVLVASCQVGPSSPKTPAGPGFGSSADPGGNPSAYGSRPWLRGLLLGLVAGGVTTLKSTYIVPSAVFLLCFAVLVFRRAAGLLPTLKLLAAAALAAIVVLLPWAIVNHTAAGTLFYPSLGLGFHYTRWGGFAPPGNHSAAVILFKVLPFSLPPFAVFLLGWTRGRRDLPARAAMTMTLAAALSTILVGIATGGDSVRRYNYPALLPGMLLLFPVLCRPVTSWRARTSVAFRPRLRWLAATIAAGTALYVGFNSFTWEYPWAIRCLRTSLTDYRILPNKVLDPAEGDRIRSRYQALEAAIPATGGATLETLTDSYLLDFGRRQIFLADVPGAASPPPGWPARQSGDQLASYLLAHGIRYLAYSYGDGASETDKAASEQTANPHNSQWIRSEAEIVLAAHHQYEDLGATRRHLYDDGSNFLLDLAERTAPPPPTASAATPLDPRLPLR